MSTDVNIQTLFAQIRLEHFLVYLPGNGWHGTPEIRADRLRFELSNNEAPFVLLLPRSNQSRQCKKLLQHAIYNLSGIEDRQPTEIIRDLLVVDTSETPACQTQQTVRVRLRNLHATQLNLQIASRSADNLLMPDETIEIVLYPSKGGPSKGDPLEENIIEIGFKGSTIQIDDLANK
jgi:hypothetical protein